MAADDDDDAAGAGAAAAVVASSCWANNLAAFPRFLRAFFRMGIVIPWPAKWRVRAEDA